MIALYPIKEIKNAPFLKKGAPKTSLTFYGEVQRPREIVEKVFAELFSKSDRFTPFLIP
jgi:hypothetical protein